jgi:hypothetical protein
MRPAIAALVLAVTLGVIAARSGPASSQCLPSVTYNGTSYLGVRTVRTVPTGEFVGHGAFPGCNDFVIEGGPPANEPDRPVDVHRAGNVDPAIALKTPVDNTLYLAPGFLPKLRSHPLHSAIFGTASDRAARGCGRQARLAGHVSDDPAVAFVDLNVSHHSGPFPTTNGRPTFIGLRSWTRYRGPLRLGLPYLRAGARMWAIGRFCFRPQNIFVAQAIRVLAAKAS